MICWLPQYLDNISIVTIDCGPLSPLAPDIWYPWILATSRYKTTLYRRITSVNPTTFTHQPEARRTKKLNQVLTTRTRWTHLERTIWRLEASLTPYPPFWTYPPCHSLPHPVSPSTFGLALTPTADDRCCTRAALRTNLRTRDFGLSDSQLPQYITLSCRRLHQLRWILDDRVEAQTVSKWTQRGPLHLRIKRKLAGLSKFVVIGFLSEKTTEKTATWSIRYGCFNFKHSNEDPKRSHQS